MGGRLSPLLLHQRKFSVFFCNAHLIFLKNWLLIYDILLALILDKFNYLNRIILEA